MSGPDHWWDAARSTWEQTRLRLARLAPGPGVSPDQLASEETLTRWRALRALMGRPNPGLISGLIEMTGDPDEMVRAGVADVLVSWGPTTTLEPVRAALAAHPGPDSAATLLAILARLPDPANRGAIAPWLQSDDVAVRAAAFMALAALCDNEDLPSLEKALADEDVTVQRAIMTTLCAPDAGPLAAKSLAASDPILRQRAVQAQPRIQREKEVRSKEQGARSRE